MSTNCGQPHTSVAINTFTTNPDTNLVFHPGAGWINLNHAPTDNTFIRRLLADEVKCPGFCS